MEERPGAAIDSRLQSALLIHELVNLISFFERERRRLSKNPVYARSAVVNRRAELAPTPRRHALLCHHRQDIPVLAPIIHREILYRMLAGPSCDRLRHIAQFGSQTNRVNKAVTWIRENYKSTVSIEDLAKIARMGISTFHRHFQELTTMSPIQYQKHLRLHEARRLMLVENSAAASSALQVGYESVTQFNREYRRLFGQPPATDKRKLLESDPPRTGSVA